MTEKITLQLLSPVAAECLRPYENPWDSGEEYRIMNEPEKVKCIKEIGDAITNLFNHGKSDYGFIEKFRRNPVGKKIVISCLRTKNVSDRIMLVLECKCTEKLNDMELDELCGWWENEIVEANEKLKK